MPEFLVRAHAAPVSREQFLAQVGEAAHVEYLADIVLNALFVSKGHREDVDLTLVLENSKDFSRALTLSGSALGSIHGQHEAALLGVLADALSAGAGLGKDASVRAPAGVLVAATAFEKIIAERLASRPVFLLDPKGDDLRSIELPEDPVFVLTDHVPMPRNLRKSILGKGGRPVSLGPVMLHGSQCIDVILNEWDYQGWRR